ncbi:MAG TPA: PIN domain-containing protein [Verrucomicrobiae bacterium]|nr:PIN domain-containing protein [Verrucomicrobiae bacterium]
MDVILADTGALVALLDRSDHLHNWALGHFKALRPPLFTCEAVLAEAWHLLGEAPPSRTALARLHREGILDVRFDFQSEAPVVWRLLEKYRDVPMDLADACLVRMSELFPRSHVWTTDSDFRVYRRMGRQAIPRIAPF